MAGKETMRLLLSIMPEPGMPVLRTDVRGRCYRCLARHFNGAGLLEITRGSVTVGQGNSSPKGKANGTAPPSVKVGAVPNPMPGGPTRNRRAKRQGTSTKLAASQGESPAENNRACGH